MGKIRLQAHRGVSTDYPENTMAAFAGAVEQGYDVIELDPAVTADGKFIIMHDKTLNRTGRTLDGKVFAQEKLVEKTDYAEIAECEFGSWFDKRFAGEKAPLLEQVLLFAQKNDIPIKIDNKFENFAPDVLENFLSLVENYNARLAFTCKTVEMAKKIAKRFADAEIHFDGLISEEILKTLSGFARGRLTVWAPMQNKNTSWVKVKFVDGDMASLIKKYANLGVWILSTEEEYLAAKALGADIIETTGAIKPRKGE